MRTRTTLLTTETGNPAWPGADAPASTAAASDAVLANRDVRDVAATGISALVTTELSRCHADWRRTLEGVKEALAGLDRTCKTAINDLPETQAKPAAAVSTLVDTLVAAATANADAAVQRTRADAQIEIANLQALVGRLQAELHATRERLQTAREECDEEHSARGRAEAARDEAQGAYSHLVSASESQLHGVQAELEAERAASFRLHQQLEAEQAERARLIAAVQTVQRAVSFAEPVRPAPDPPRPLTPRHDAAPDRPPADREPDAAPEPTEVHAPAAATTDAPNTAAAVAPPANRTLTLVSHAPSLLDTVRKRWAACRRARPYSLLMLLDHIYRSRRRLWTTTREGRYTVVIEECLNGTVGRLTIRQGPILIGTISAFLLPILIGLGAKWSVQAEINHLRATQKVLRIENGSYRAATGELTAQIQSLESVIDDLGARSALDPVGTHAMQKLPAVVKSRASGGSSVQMSAALSNALAVSLSSPDDTFSAVRGLLRRLENRLTLARSDVVPREAPDGATPSVWPTHGWLTSTFGTRSDPFSGEPGYHRGVDISTEKGQPVLATADGAVESASYAGDYGNLVVLKHGFGWSTRYGHLSGFAVNPRQDVKRGGVIGYVGSTGRSTGPHLHYEIVLNDHLIDPLQLLTGTPTPPKATAATPSAVAATATDGRFDIVVASFRTDARATSAAAVVAALGLPIRQRASGGWRQVVSGPFASRTDAEEAQQRLRRAGLTGTQLVLTAR